MTNQESDADNRTLNNTPNNNHRTSFLEDLKIHLKNWVLALLKDVSGPLGIIAREMTIIVALILSDMFVLWLLGLALEGEFVWLFVAIRLFSAITIAVTFLGDCMIEILRNRREVLAAARQTD